LKSPGIPAIKSSLELVAAERYRIEIRPGFDVLTENPAAVPKYLKDDGEA
jgi:hypothetical protein